MSNGTTAFPGLSQLSSAIANAEGYGVSGAIPTLANNPGNLTLGDIGGGTLGQNITVYPDSTAGWNGLNNQLQMIMNGQSRIYNPNMSLQQMGTLWAGGGTGSQNWVNNVANYLGVDPNSTIGSILLGNPSTAGGTGAAGSSAAAAGGAGGLLQAAQDYWKMLSNPAQYVADKAGSTLTGLLFSSRLIMLVVGMILIFAGAVGFVWTHGEDIVSGATEPAFRARRIGKRVQAAAEIAAI
jgi:hypothetical protein